MATFQAPYGPGRIQIPDERAARYREAGWREVKPKAEATPKPEKKATTKRSKAEKSE